MKAFEATQSQQVQSPLSLAACIGEQTWNVSATARPTAHNSTPACCVHDRCRQLVRLIWPAQVYLSAGFISVVLCRVPPWTVQVLCSSAPSFAQSCCCCGCMPLSHRGRYIGSVEAVASEAPCCAPGRCHRITSNEALHTIECVSVLLVCCSLAPEVAVPADAF